MKIEVSKLQGCHPAARPHDPPALKNLTFSIGSAEQVAIIGPSGAGKTTALQILSCSLRPVSGSFLLDGQNPWSFSRKALQKFRARLFVAPQVPPLPPRQRVVTSVLAGQLPQMSFLRSLRSLFYPVNIAAAEQALADYDLAEKLFERVDRLSGGERQRVGLARALMSRAELILVDEPLSALDPARAEQAMSTLTARARERSATLVCTLHQVDMALRHFPRIVGLKDGEMVFDLSSADVTQDILAALYAQHPEELNGPALDRSDIPGQPKPIVMQCR